MLSKTLFSKKTSILILIAIILICLGIVSLILGQIWIALILTTIGLGIIIKQWQFLGNQNFENYHRSRIEKEPFSPAGESRVISFWNLPVSRIFVILIIFIFALIDATVFRTPLVDRYNPIGSWQILMGPTLFYPLVFLPLVMACGMLFHLLFSIRKITLIRTDTKVSIQERGLIRLTNDIHLDQVNAAQFCSNFTGLKALWVIPWSIQIWGNFSSAWHYFSNEFTFGTGLYIGPVYLIHSFIYSIILVILIFAPENEFKWETASQEYSLRAFAYKLQKVYSHIEIAGFLTLNPESVQINENNSKNLKKRNYFLCLGIFLFILPILSIIFTFLFSDIPRIFIFMGSMASFAVALKDYGYKQENLNPFGYLRVHIRNVDQHPIHRGARHHPLVIMVYTSELAQILSIGIILTLKWRLYPLLSSHSSLMWVDIIGSSLFGCAMLYLYLKKQWEILKERNRVLRMMEFMALGLGILLAFLL
jgi:hypothetical protein